MTGAAPLSIVVAAVNSRETLTAWLDAIRPQVRRHRAEVLLAAAADDGEAERAASEPFVRIVRGAPGSLVPSLWGSALLEARGAIVAITISACVPDPGWLDAIVASYAETAVDGIGGVIEPWSRGATVDRALHLVRYTPYLPPIAAGPVTEVAGDNGTYTRSALNEWRDEIVRNGFWESEFNRHIRGRGGVLRIDPRILVTHTHSYSFAGFSRQRFRHGRVFGRSRRATTGTAGRLVRVALAPTVPAIMLTRSLRTVAARGRLDVRSLDAVPAAGWFFCCWAVGEATGLLRG